MLRSEGERVVPVTVDGRKFKVVFDKETSEPKRIVERKLYRPGTRYESWYEAGYWHASHHRLGKAWTLPQRILKEARLAL